MTECLPYKQPPMHELGRFPDVEAEAQVLGSIIHRPELYDDVLPMVRRDDFSSEWHRYTWDCLTDLVNSGAKIDRASVCNALNRYVDYSGGGMTVEAFIEGICYRSITPSNAVFYASLVKGDAIRRNICTTAPMLTVVANDFNLTLEEVRNRVNDLIARAMDEEHNEGLAAHASEVVEEVIDEILEDAIAGKRRTGPPTGLLDLDYTLSGMPADDVIIVAARTSVGKSAFALRVVESFCKRGECVVYFSLEMSSKSLVERLVSMYTRVPLSLVRNRMLNELQRQLVKNAKETIGNWDLQIDEKPGVSPHYVRSRCRSYMRKRPIDLIVVDHMHIMEPTTKTGDEVKDRGEITRELHNIARELRTPVLVLAQLNRGPENRQDPVPTLRDLRGSGGIEENADAILGIHRPEYKKMRDSSHVLPEIETAEIHILKNRNGPAGGMVSVSYKSDCVRFDNLAKDYPATATTAQPVMQTQGTADAEDPFAMTDEDRARLAAMNPMAGWNPK